MAKQTQKRQPPLVDYNKWYDTFAKIAASGGTHKDVQIAIGRGRTTVMNWSRVCAPAVHIMLSNNYWNRRKRADILHYVAQEELKGTTNKEMSYIFGFTPAGMCNWRKRNRVELDRHKEMLQWQNSRSS